MAVQNEYDDGVPLRFVWERLTGNDDFQALYRDLLFEEIRVPSKPGDSYITVKTREIHVALWAGLPEYIGKVTSEASIYCTKKYPSGKGSEMDFRQIMKILRRAVCGVSFAEVHLDGEKIGEVHESAFIRKLPLVEYGDGNFDTLKKGILVRIVHK